MSQESLVRYVAETFNVIEVGRSIAEHGFFVSEPLIAVPESGGNRYIVLEGNRRLVALKLLGDPLLAAGLDDAREWEQLASSAIVPKSVPVVIASTRESVAPIIGYRHISGIQPWEPFAKARFIANLVDSGMEMREVASIVGDSRTNVASHYRNFKIVSQARTKFSLDTSRVEDDFGIFTRAMSQVALRKYIKAPAPAQVQRGKEPIPSNRRANTEELFSWLFGDDDNPQVIEESRDITNLGKVLESEHAIEVLKATRDLAAAGQAAGGPKARLMNLLTAAKSNLISARTSLHDFQDDPDVDKLLEEIQQQLDELKVGAGGE